MKSKLATSAALALMTVGLVSASLFEEGRQAESSAFNLEQMRHQIHKKSIFRQISEG